MELAVDQFKNLGFTEVESKCLYTLIQNSKLTGYEVSKRIGVSRSNVYAALESLLNKGFILVSKGERTFYYAIPLDEIQLKLEQSMQKSFQQLQKTLHPKSIEVDDFYTLTGEKQVVDRIQLQLSKTKTELFADFWSEETTLFGEFLMEAQEKGLHVIVSALGSVDLPIKHVLVQEPEQYWQNIIGRNFSFLLDREVAIVGIRGNEVETKALITKHPAIVRMVLNHFYHDAVLHDIKKDMKEEMENRYGPNFEEIVRKYTGKGWGI